MKQILHVTTIGAIFGGCFSRFVVGVFGAFDVVSDRLQLFSCQRFYFLPVSGVDVFEHGLIIGLSGFRGKMLFGYHGHFVPTVP